MANEDLVYAPTDESTLATPEAGMQRQVLAFNSRLMLVRHHLEKGWKGTRHKHPHDQLVYVVRGAIVFAAAGKTLELRSGDSAVVAGGIEHEAQALEESEVLDVFTPYREDYARLV